MANQQRLQRISEAIKKELAILLQREVKDPRVGFVTLSGIKVSRDLSVADVYVSWLDDHSPDEIASRIKTLQGAAGYLRSALAQRVKLRVMPKLRFHQDDSAQYSIAISQLLKESATRPSD